MTEPGGNGDGGTAAIPVLGRLLVSRWVFLAVSMALGFLVALRAGVFPDAWWHLAAGRWMWEHGEILRADPFSWTHLGAPWTLPSWLADLGAFGTYRAFGLQGAQVLYGVVFAVAVAVTAGRFRGDLAFRGALVLALAYFAGKRVGTRPETYTLLFVALTVLLLDRGRRTRTGEWVLVPLLVLWGNLHAGFALGFGLVGLDAVASIVDGLRTSAQARAMHLRRGIRLSMIGIASAAVLVIANPYGADLLRYPLDTLQLNVLRESISEWQPVLIWSLRAIPIGVFSIAAAISLWRTDSRPRTPYLLRLIVFTLFAFAAVRNLALMLLVVLPIIGEHAPSRSTESVAPSSPEPPVPDRLRQTAEAALVSAVGVAVLIVRWPVLAGDANAAVIRSAFPVVAVEHIEERTSATPRLYNRYVWGGWIAWAGGHVRPYIDGRTDLYGDDFVREAIDLERARDLTPIDERDIDVVLTSAGGPLDTALSERGWQTTYRDDLAAVLQRPSGRS